MEKKPMFSEQISAFLTLLDQIKKDNDWNGQEVVRLDRLTQDYLHMLELEDFSSRDRARVAKDLKACRVERRRAKDIVATTQPMVDFLAGERGKMMIAQLQQVLGKVRREENHIAQRTYTPKALSQEDFEARNR